MLNNSLLHSISPSKVIRGEDAWEEGIFMIPNICKKPLLLGRSFATLELRKSLINDLASRSINTLPEELKYDCCEIDLKRLSKSITKNNCDGVIAVGGGKVMDSAKILSQRLSIPCITIPSSAATCAGWTALSNIYSPEGAFIRDENLDKCPDLLIFDYSLIRKAPRRTLASGIADALAKWYEASLTSNTSKDGLTQQAVQMARVLRDQLFIDSYEAFQNRNTDAWVRVAEGCGLTAGLIGGIGGAKCRTAAAHAIHNGLTQINTSNKNLHGEMVGFGILVQLRLEEIISGNQLATQSRTQLYPFFKSLRLPTTLNDLNLKEISNKQLEKVALFACKNESEIHNLPFNVSAEVLREALLQESTRKMLSNMEI